MEKTYRISPYMRITVAGSSDQPQCTTVNDLFIHSPKANFILDLLRYHAVASYDSNSVNASGNPIPSIMPEEELVARVFKIADLTFSEFIKKEMVTIVPSFDELDLMEDNKTQND